MMIMTTRVRCFLLFSVAALTAAATRAEITLAPLFTDHAVLQCDKPLPVWGRAPANQKIAVTFRDQTVGTTVGADGRWIVYLDPVAASTQSTELVVATARESIAIRDVLVGEVWLAAGQSNMEWPVSRVHADELKIAATTLPLVRELKIERAVAVTPLDTAKTTSWRSATPETVGGFSAVGYFFARELQRKLGVPVGIVHSSWGGTAIESWMSDATRQGTPLSATLDARWRQAMSEWPPERVAGYPAEQEKWRKAEEQARATKTKSLLPWPQPPATNDSPARPGGVFNAMIAPVQPGALRGILWYQGESNLDRPEEYKVLFPALIRAWRSNWGDDSLPFYFVQLANFADSEDPTGRRWARLRDAQLKALELPSTAMAVAIDVGDAEDLHPSRKMEVGRRLALIAKVETYHLPGDSIGPVFSGATREGAAMRVRFLHASGGLIAYDRPVQSLEIAGADKVFHPATGKIERDTLLVSSPKVPAPVAVRYAWTNAPLANLYNGAGLPAEPFRSDDW